MKSSTRLSSRFFVCFICCIITTNIFSQTLSKPDELLSNNKNKILQGLNIQSSVFTPIDIFGPLVDRVENIDGIDYLTSKTLKPDERWQIIIGSPQIDVLLKAKTPNDFIEALSQTGNSENLGFGCTKTELIAQLNSSPKDIVEIHIHRIYLDGKQMYSLLMDVFLREQASGNPSPDLVTIPMATLQRYDSTVIQRLTQTQAKPH